MAGQKRTTPKSRGPRTSRLSKARLDLLVEAATVDAYNDDEQVMGLFTMIEEHLVLPFQTAILGMAVTVERVNVNDATEIVAICRHGRERQAIPVVDLPLPSPPPSGHQWIAAYRHWARGR
jgi:hypothetical protein